MEQSTSQKELQEIGQKAVDDDSSGGETEDDKEVPPSWVRSPTWSKSTFSEAKATSTAKDNSAAEGKMAEVNALDAAPAVLVTPLPLSASAISASSSPGPALSRISSSTVFNPLRPRSQTLLRPPGTHAPLRPKTAGRQRSYHTLRATPFVMSAAVQTSTAPQPSLRRSKSGSRSHPDLTSLVDDWSREGPANDTWVYPALNANRQSSSPSANN